jgi:hypothetical protein
LNGPTFGHLLADRSILKSSSGAYSPIFGHFDNYGLGTQSYFDY